MPRKKKEDKRIANPRTYEEINEFKTHELLKLLRKVGVKVQEGSGKSKRNLSKDELVKLAIPKAAEISWSDVIKGEIKAPPSLRPTGREVGNPLIKAGLGTAYYDLQQLPELIPGGKAAEWIDRDKAWEKRIEEDPTDLAELTLFINKHGFRRLQDLNVPHEKIRELLAIPKEPAPHKAAPLSVVAEETPVPKKPRKKVSELKKGESIVIDPEDIFIGAEIEPPATPEPEPEPEPPKKKKKKKIKLKIVKKKKEEPTDLIRDLIEAAQQGTDTDEVELGSDIESHVPEPEPEPVELEDKGEPIRDLLSAILPNDVAHRKELIENAATGRMARDDWVGELKKHWGEMTNNQQWAWVWGLDVGNIHQKRPALGKLRKERWGTGKAQQIFNEDYQGDPGIVPFFTDRYSNPTEEERPHIHAEHDDDIYTEGLRRRIVFRRGHDKEHGKFFKRSKEPDPNNPYPVVEVQSAVPIGVVGLDEGKKVLIPNISGDLPGGDLENMDMRARERLKEEWITSPFRKVYNARTSADPYERKIYKGAFSRKKDREGLYLKHMRKFRRWKADLADYEGGLTDTDSEEDTIQAMMRRRWILQGGR